MNLQCCFYACRIANSKSSIKLAKRQLRHLRQPTKESFSHSGISFSSFFFFLVREDKCNLLTAVSWACPFRGRGKQYWEHKKKKEENLAVTPKFATLLSDDKSLL